MAMDRKILASWRAGALAQLEAAYTALPVQVLRSCGSGITITTSYSRRQNLIRAVVLAKECFGVLLSLSVNEDGFNPDLGFECHCN